MDVLQDVLGWWWRDKKMRIDATIIRHAATGSLHNNTNQKYKKENKKSTIVLSESKRASVVIAA